MKDGFIKVAAATPGIRVADVAYNTAQIKSMMEKAVEEGAKVVVFPELCLTGYTCGDLFTQEILLEQAKQGLKEIGEAPRDMDALVFVGLPLEENGELYNVAAALNRGRVLGFTTKSFLPNYGEFYEMRQFRQGPSRAGEILFEGRRVPFGPGLLYEAESLEACIEGKVYECSWEPEASVYKWYSEQDGDETVIYANFQGKNPNGENVEINVRRNCFYPDKEGVGYITLSGFTVTKAATQWAPPTAYQEGMIGPHWSKGWIIEDCEVSHSKCSGISLGKYKQPNNDNKWLTWKFKDGTQTERDCICQAQREGWTKENIGSHIIRRCNIHDCGQTGIVGHLGGVFSLIEDNHIHHINNKQNLAGAEIGGIKMHAAIDVIYRRNHIHHCTRGLWLDWQAQGTRVTQNLFHDNCLPLPDDCIDPNDPGMGEDIFIEVSHGPTLVDNNLLLSDRSVKLATQGVAFVHNLIAGALTAVGKGTDNGALTLSSPRYTPYHVPHRTEVAGFMTFLHGDDRFYNNIFLQQPKRPGMVKIYNYLQGEGKNGWDDGNLDVGTWMFDNGYQLYEEWVKEFEGYCGMGSPDSDRYYIHLPVWAEGNVYLNGAKPWKKEKNCVVDDTHEVTLSLEEKDGEWKLNTNLYEILPEITVGTISTETLGMAFEPEEYYENPDGSPITFSEDYFGNHRSLHPCVGPFENPEDAGKKLS